MGNRAGCKTVFVGSGTGRPFEQEARKFDDRWKLIARTSGATADAPGGRGGLVVSLRPAKLTRYMFRPSVRDGRKI